MIIDHHTRLDIAREHADRLRETMLASRRKRRPDERSNERPTVQIFTLPRPVPRVERDAAA